MPKNVRAVPKETSQKHTPRVLLLRDRTTNIFSNLAYVDVLLNAVAVAKRPKLEIEITQHYADR